MNRLVIHRFQEVHYASYDGHTVVSETLSVSSTPCTLLRIIELVCYPENL